MDTGAGPTFINDNVLPAEILKNMKRETLPVRKDANKLGAAMRGTIRMKGPLVSFTPMVKFPVCEKLGVAAILGGKFWERFVEAIYAQRKCVVLGDACTIPIIHKVF